MEKERLYQLELFSDPDCAGDTVPKASSAFIQYLRSYEKAVLVIILVLVVAVAAFSCGVEKGKRSVARSAPLVARQLKAQPTLQQSKVQMPVLRDNRVVSGKITSSATAVVVRKTAVTPVLNSRQIQQAQRQAEPLIPGGKAVAKLAGSYTIQLGTYRSKSQVGKEADVLRRKGGVPMVSFKEPFYVLSLGSFQDKRSAELWLLKLKKQYKDSFIRRL